MGCDGVRVLSSGCCRRWRSTSISPLTHRTLCDWCVVQINAEKSPYLTDKLKIWMLPTLALIKSEKVSAWAGWVICQRAVG